MTAQAIQRVLTLEPSDSQHLAALCGQLNENLKLIEQRMQVRIAARANTFQVSGDEEAVDEAVHLLKQLYRESIAGTSLSPESVHLRMQQANREQFAEQNSDDEPTEALVIRTKKGSIKPRGGNQQNYVRAIQGCDVNFGIGPAGTGKTYLAVACAVEALISHSVERILLVRPAVEAGEKLGFLPGDLAQKIDPYLRPLYDALYEMLGSDTVTKLIERNVIEIAPLAYMRGRTLNDSFIILDEAQNTTREQMKMFLTRIGFGSTAVITGDATQIDLPRGTPSGLVHVMKVLDGVDGISLTYFQSRDVVRHPLVQKIVEAYAAYEDTQG
ncbi:PhoH family protein [Spongiibacter sp. KMU-166]|uniref:PhoH-like protein n=1 Tax=Spongiibacter thalassae TaxID=2721624 RepID=A0ABX1GIA9_9GAMM|nr:PhoH family protein [Spongiibacter thalassae]NKI18962.1 PhoH family protein [Spongiibacter thalassae]